jgi:ribosomal protein L44E
MPVIHIAAGDYTHALVKRQIGKTNIGFYCDKCGEFIAMAVSKPKDDHKINEVQFACDGPLQISCPFCQHPQKHVVSEFRTLRLTEGNKRRPPPAGTR